MNITHGSTAAWRKSSYSVQEGSCIEVAVVGRCIATRDSKRADGPLLAFRDAAWLDFVGAVRSRVCLRRG